MLKKLACAIALLSAPLFQSLAIGQQCPECKVPEGPALDCPLAFDGLPVLRIQEQAACRAGVTASYGESRSERCQRTFGPPFLLVDHRVAIHSSNNGNFSVSQFASGTKLEMKEQIEEAYDQAIDLAIKYGDTAAEGSLREAKKRHLDYYLRFETNKDTLALSVSASGHGSAIDRKRGWQDASVIARVICIAPVNLTDQLTANFLNPPDQLILRNDLRKEQYLAWGTVTPGTICSTVVQPTITLVHDTGREALRLPELNGTFGKACIRLFDSLPVSSGAAVLCEYSGGTRLDFSAVPLNCKN